MFCPKCRAEFREGFSRCEGCEKDLVEEKDLPPEREKGWIESLLVDNSEPEPELTGNAAEAGLVPAEDICPPEAGQVFESADPFLINAVTDLLNERQITFFVQRGERVVDAPSAIFGSNFQPAVDPVMILVLPEREEEVRKLLEDFRPLPGKGGLAFADLPPELAEATDEPDPETEDGAEYEPVIPGTEGTEEAEPVFCPHCRAKLELTDEEMEEGKFSCPVCGETIEFEDE